MKYLSTEIYQVSCLNGDIIKRKHLIDGGYTIMDKDSQSYIFTNDLEMVSCGFSYIDINLTDFQKEKKQLDIYIKEISDFINASCYVKNYKIILRKKKYVKILVNISNVLSKYELLIKFRYNSELALVSYGITGTFELFKKKCNYKELIFQQIKILNYKVLNISYQGNSIVLLGNQATGFLCHEGIGHMAEADFVKDGSAFKGNLGKKIFGNNITIIDCGDVECGAGNIIFDDEGVLSKKNEIIKGGILNTYLTNKEAAKYFGLKNTGNARSAFWNQPSFIRMTNTYLESGKKKVEDLISQVNYGYYICDTVKNGRCKPDGTFEINASNALVLEKGNIVGRLKNIQLIGDIFLIFNRFYEIGNDTKLCLGTSKCGKYSSIKVDAGGPHVLTECYLKIG